MSGGLDIEGVLAGHDVAGWRETRAENELAGIAALYRPECSCGELLDARDRVGSWRAHVAAVLREQIAAWLVDAETIDLAYDVRDRTGKTGAVLAALAALVAPSRVPGEET